MGDTLLHLRWHSHNTTFTGMLQDLHVQRAFTDVSLICVGGIVRTHKAVLSLSSRYLASVLSSYKGSEEASILLPGVPLQDIRFLLSFIYTGQVDVPQEHFASFLNTGKHLHVHGLEQGERVVYSPFKSEENSSSDPEDEIPKMQNNNFGERNNLVKLDVASKNSATNPNFIKPEAIKTENIKTENIKTEEVKVEKDIPEEGKIDLNFYLQQAIQSASMPCPLCNKEFKSQSGLRDHIRLHTGERPFICEFCHMNFARASHLKRHRRMHTGEKPFECSICGKDFSRGDKLKDHLRRHEAENKLTQIRQQILNMDDKSDQDMSTVGTSTNGNVSSFNTCLTSMQPSMILSKSSTDLLLPASKRQCLNPKVPLLAAMAHIPQEPLHNLIASSQPEANIPPSLMGVTSIGECILRPIN